MVFTNIYSEKGGVNMANLVYINTHDTGRRIDPYGFNANTKTLMEFAKDATLFTNAYSVAPTCSPSRSGLLTGTYPHQNGMLGLAQRGFGLNDTSKHLAAYLSQKGFRTAISGIQHESGWYLDLDIEANKSLGYQEVLTSDSSVYPREELHLWDRKNAQNAANWILDRNSDEPFMLSYGLHSTHRPYPITVNDSVNPNYVVPQYPIPNNKSNRIDEAQYITSAMYADESIKIVLDALKDKGVYDNTIILFTTDHGVPLPFNKCSLNDNGIGVSFILRNPFVNVQGQVFDQLISHIDVFPTLCEMLGIESPEYLEGKSFTPIFDNHDFKVRDHVFAEINFHASYEPSRCVRTERYKYIRHFDEEWLKVNLANIDESQPKDFLIDHGLRDITKPVEGLYDLYFDPNEASNLVDDHKYAEILDGLRATLKEYMLSTNDPLLQGHIQILPQYKVNSRQSLEASSKNPDDYDSLGVK